MNISKIENRKSKINDKKIPYDPSQIELKWQEKWEKDRIYQPQLNRGQPDLSSANGSHLAGSLQSGGQAGQAGSPQGRPYYNLHMFPYPSAEGLHVGNVYAFTGADIYGRFKRMQGNNVFQPFGLDGFGIHSENYALKVGTHPMDQAEKSEGRFYAQVKALGSGYDWSHTLETYDPDYYRWTQWLFIELFKAGLAYRESVAVNFCPSCKTVLADEQVIQKLKTQNSKLKNREEIMEVSIGVCERCDTEVEKKDLEQWMFRITEYAEQLLSGLDKIDWTEKVKIAQRNWIGKSGGAKITFVIANSAEQRMKQSDQEEIATSPKAPRNDSESIQVFTTRPDTLYGVTFLVVSPEHPFVGELLNPKSEIRNPKFEVIREYVELAKSKEDSFEKDVTGIFSGAYAINPINNQQMPIWIADYVLMSYGTGAIMAVPAHDERDFAFAKKYDLPIVEVVASQTGTQRENEERRDGGCGVVFDPKSQKYAVATHPDGLLRLFAGGVGDGEDLEKGILREVTEESGLHDFKHVERIQTSFTHFYNSRKKVNRSALATCYLAVLKSTNLKQTHLEEHEKAFELAWMSADEILENWSTRNDDHGMDHWVDFMHQSVGRAIELGYDKTSDPQKYKTSVYVGSGILVNSGEWNELEMPAQKNVVIKNLEDKGIGSGYTNYHLRDWLISRQRYWGPPIPMIFCEACAKAGKSWFTSEKAKQYKVLGSEYKVEEKKNIPYTKYLIHNTESMKGWYPAEELPVVLPRIDDYKPIGTGPSPLGNHPEFYETTCPECGSAARRETDVSDTFLDSSWYFLRYLATDLKDLPFPMSEQVAQAITNSKFEARNSRQNQNKKDTKSFRISNFEIRASSQRTAWLPVMMYTGGAEHSVLHLLYTRFFYKVLVDLGYIDPAGGDEPFPRFFAHGLIIKDGSKMSKSKGNVIIPDSYIEKFGADTLRSYLMFLGPFDMGGDFRDSGIEGMNRFIQRVWRLVTQNIAELKTQKDAEGQVGVVQRNSQRDSASLSAMNEAIRGVTADIKSFKYNTAIAKIMTYYNFLAKEETVSTQEAKVLLQLLAPFAPHMTEELYQHYVIANRFPSGEIVEQSNQGGIATDSANPRNDKFESIHLSEWPTYDEQAISSGKVVIAVQVNGKLRGTMPMQSGNSIAQNEMEDLAKKDPTVQKQLEGKTIKKVIYVPGKILNFVVS